MKKHLTPTEAAALIPDGAVVTVSSSSGLGCPDLMLKAIGERFDATGHPRDITTLHPIAAGDMSGIKGVDHIAKKGLLKRIIGGSYPSGPSIVRAAADLANDHQQRNPGLQHSVRHPVRHSSRSRRQAAGRSDQDRHRHIRRSRAAGLRDERPGCRSIRWSSACASRATTGCSFPRSSLRSPSSAPPLPTSAATSHTNMKAPISAASIRRWPHATTAASSSRRSSGSPRKAR